MTPTGGASSAGDDAPRRWTIGADRYVATFGFCKPGDVFGGSLSCVSLVRDGVELLVAPGAPLVVPWMGRLSAWSFDVAGGRLDLVGDDRITCDERGRPLHGLSVAPGAWQVDVAGAPPPASPTPATPTSRGSSLVATADLVLGDAFPFAFRITVVATIDAAGLCVRTVVDSTGGDEVPVAVGWHPYLRAPGTTPDRSGVEVFLPFAVACELAALLPTGVERAVLPGWVCDPVVDDHWRAAPGLEAVVRSGDLDVTLTFGGGYAWAMTWVPHVGAGFVCVEPMAAPLDPFRPGTPTPLAAAGRPWVGEFTIR